MGQVIPWPSPENRPARPLREADGQGGRILLFLGVRYERHLDDGDALPLQIAGEPCKKHSDWTHQQENRPLNGNGFHQ
jgi:hypothetical protein